MKNLTKADIRNAMKQEKVILVKYRATMFGTFKNISIFKHNGKWTHDANGSKENATQAQIIEKFEGFEGIAF